MLKKTSLSALMTLALLTAGDGAWATLYRQNDYLSDDLRRQVESLKIETAAGATDKTNYEMRRTVVWAWVNALSQTEVPLNPDAPLLVIPAVDEGRWDESQLLRFDALIAELKLRDEHSQAAFGQIELSDHGPFPAGSFQRLTQTYTVANLPVSAGGGFLVGRHFQSYGFPTGTNFQGIDPSGEGYVTARCSRPGAEFAVESIDWPGLHGMDEVGTEPLLFRLVKGQLEAGDTVTLIYGDKESGSPGLRIQDYSNDSVPLPVYVDYHGKGHYLMLPLQSFQVTGNAVRGVHGFAPSVVSTGEKFSISVRSEDEFRNRATGPIPAYDVFLNGKPFGRLEGGPEPIQFLNDLSFREPGVYRFTFRSEDGKITGVANPVWVREHTPWRVYWGDTHGHSGFAEGLGTPDGYFKFGRDDARLDFLTHSEHDLWMDDREWDILKENVARFNDEGSFVTFLGYEWTAGLTVGGHHNVLFSDSRAAVASSGAVGSQAVTVVPGSGDGK